MAAARKPDGSGACALCGFSNDAGLDEGMLECRRYPPLTHASADSNNFPVVHAAAWCGEFSIDGPSPKRGR